MIRKNVVRCVFAIGCLMGLLSGCSGDRSVTGGTKGTLRTTTTELCDVRVNVYVAGTMEPIGFGITRDQGRFELYRPDAFSALYLSPGEYSFTLESLGPDPLPLAPQLRHPRRTPLRKRWSESDSTLEIVIPGSG